MSLFKTLEQDIKSSFKNGNTLMQLIIINVMVFLLMATIRLVLAGKFTPASLDEPSAFNVFFSWVAMPLNALDFIYKPYTVFTYQFIHLNIFHLIGNLIFLYGFGSILEGYIGNKQTLAIYIYGGIAGAIITTLLCTFIPNIDIQLPLIGASASVAALAVAAATINPRHEIRLLLIGPVQLYILVLGFLLINMLSVASYTNLPGCLSHIGGAAFGYLFIIQFQKGNDWSVGLNKLIEAIKSLNKPKKLKVSFRNPTMDHKSKLNAQPDEKIESILKKIKRSGYDSLTKEEKDYLFKYNK
jgi:membrane associated rhomboid family serine protease